MLDTPDHSDHPGYIYLIHFYTPIEHARHYLGWTRDLNQRLTRHAAGNGARLMQVAKARGVNWCVKQAWIGDRHLERQLKLHSHTRLCLVCADYDRRKVRKVRTIPRGPEARSPWEGGQPHNIQNGRCILCRDQLLHEPCSHDTVQRMLQDVVTAHAEFLGIETLTTQQATSQPER